MSFANPAAQLLLDKTNKEHPHPHDVKALSDLLSDNRRLELWRDVASAGYLAELMGKLGGGTWTGILVAAAVATVAGFFWPNTETHGACPVIAVGCTLLLRILVFTPIPNFLRFTPPY